MALRITSVDQNIDGPTCGHINVNVLREVQTGTFTATFAEIDDLVNQLGGQNQADLALVKLWANYRRRQGRQVVGIDIA